MKRELLKLKIDGYLKNNDVYQDDNFSALVSYYISKARHNLLTANLLKQISENLKIKKSLSLPDDYVGYDWVIGAGYYAMYHIATALLGTGNSLVTKSQVFLFFFMKGTSPFTFI